jgi:hypothetical protein
MMNSKQWAKHVGFRPCTLDNEFEQARCYFDDAGFPCVFIKDKCFGRGRTYKHRHAVKCFQLVMSRKDVRVVD